MAKITLYELSSYNGGCLVPGTFDLEETPTYQDWLSAVSNWLRRLTRELGHLCEEWIVADVEGLPRQFVGEYSLDAAYWDYREALDASYLDEDVFMAAAALDIPANMVEELYQGEFESDREFACSMAEDLGLLQEDAQWPHTCIDWDYAARELMYDYGQSDGHYFRTCY
ncbi:antirestriction protein ArdA [Pseudohaliea sp.]|uniref:antirestriction protein ArdA n=1 Tax=Pseudohaliea sp. TaxID=2740289 RepID=UPI0032EF6581